MHCKLAWTHRPGGAAQTERLPIWDIRRFERSAISIDSNVPCATWEWDINRPDIVSGDRAYRLGGRRYLHSGNLWCTCGIKVIDLEIYTAGVDVRANLVEYRSNSCCVGNA